MVPSSNVEDKPDPAAEGGRSLKQARLREHIARTADELFQAHGYPDVTMEQIAAVAGVSKRTLYKYFPAREAVLAYSLENELARDMAGLRHRVDPGAGFHVNASVILAESAAWCERHPDYLLPYIRFKFANFDPNAERARAHTGDGDMVQAWTALILAAQQRGELDATRDAQQLAVYFHYLYFGALMRWVTDRSLDLQQEFSAVVQLFVNGARAP